jgi:hypothetical protein
MFSTPASINSTIFVAQQQLLLRQWARLQTESTFYCSGTKAVTNMSYGDERLKDRDVEE